MVHTVGAYREQASDVLRRRLVSHTTEAGGANSALNELIPVQCIRDQRLSILRPRFRQDAPADVVAIGNDVVVVGCRLLFRDTVASLSAKSHDAIRVLLDVREEGGAAIGTGSVLEVYPIPTRR